MKLSNKICSQWEDGMKHIDKWKNNNESIVFTNGCFDILHVGHIHYLKEAKSLGDRLVLGLNSDASVKKLKGESRPINNQIDRAVMIAALEMVDLVMIFEEDDPLNLITLIKPDVLVKGGDWKIEQIVGAKEVISNGGKVKSLSFLDGYSTTSLIDKISNEN